MAQALFTGHSLPGQLVTQQARDVKPMLLLGWSSVYDAGTTLNQHWFNVSCVLGPRCLQSEALFSNTLTWISVS